MDDVLWCNDDGCSSEPLTSDHVRYVRAPEGSVVLTRDEANECLWTLNPCAEPCNTPDECGCSVGLKIRRLTGTKP